jgi:hypothetical protein
MRRSTATASTVAQQRHDEVLHVTRHRQRRHQVQVGSKSHRRVPDVRHEQHVVVLRHPPDAPRF